jgi:hypothetical protein
MYILNKLRNVFPKLNTNSNLEHSPSPNTSALHPRIKSAHHMNYDKEKLYEENLSLKNEINKLTKALNYTKKENYNLELDLNKKDKMLEELAIDTQNSMINQIEKVNDLYGQNKLLTRATETHLIVNLKKQFKELKKEFNKKKEEHDELKKTLKNTKINEITNENRILIEEIGKLKTLYEFSLQQNSNNERYLKDFLQLKDNFSKQEYIIITLQENLKKMQEEILYKDEELTKVNKSLNDKLNQVTKLKKDLKFQYQINERLIMSTGNIKLSNEYISMKTEMDKKLSEYKKDNLYYKELADKRERKIKELESMIRREKLNMNNVSGQAVIKEEENPEEKTNHTILLLKSKLQETIKERDYLKNLNEELNSRISQQDLNDGYNNLAHSSNNNYAINTNFDNQIEYLSEFYLNELIYILIKNFEANKIDGNIIEERVLKDANSMSILPLLLSNEREFCEKMTNNILILLKV